MLRRIILLSAVALTALCATAQTSGGVRGKARHPKQFVGPNEPIGEGRGIHPGRVAWIHAPGVASWDGETGLWVEDRWNSQAKADAMVRAGGDDSGGQEERRKGMAGAVR